MNVVSIGSLFAQMATVAKYPGRGKDMSQGYLGQAWSKFGLACRLEYASRKRFQHAGLTQ